MPQYWQPSPTADDPELTLLRAARDHQETSNNLDRAVKDALAALIPEPRVQSIIREGRKQARP